MKKFAYIFCAVALVGWVAFRFAAIGSENSRYVFNATRVAVEQGAPADVLEIHKDTGILKEPLSVKNNRALVSSARAYKFRAGQNIGDGIIVSVSNNIDLDSGMHIVKTRGVTDGLSYAESEKTGYFIPAHAINNGVVMVSENGVAKKRDIQIAAQDSNQALISMGLTDGDIVILSKIGEGDKIKIHK